MNKAAMELGRLGKGKPKTYTVDELARRTSRLNDARIKYQTGRRKASAELAASKIVKLS
jgi:hypothetical protein